ncbi:MAG: MFS transporter, partial [Tepidiformaceae bacterium]
MNVGPAVEYADLSNTAPNDGGPAAADSPKGVFYGWWLLAGSVFAMAIGSGVSFWAFGLYVEPLEDEFGWSRASVSLGFSLAILVSGLTSPFVGRWIDSRGPRSAVLMGASLTAVTYLLMATVSSLWEWYVFGILNAIVRQMMFIIPFQTLISRWFDKRRGVALSVLGTGFSLGGVIVVPIMSFVIDSWGWDGSFVFSAVMIAVVFIPFAVLLLRNSPADMGTWPDGVPPAADAPEKQEGWDGLTLSQAIRTPLFWTLAFGLMLFLFGLFGWLIHSIPFYEDQGISRNNAALIVSLAAGAGVFTRLGMGFVADKVGKFEYIALGLVASLFAAMTSLYLNSSSIGIAVFLVFWVIGTGGGPMMEALLLTRAFGVRHFATIFGAVLVVETLGQVISPTVAGAIYDATGSYDWALVMFMGTFAAAFVLFAISARMPRPYQQP